MNISELDLEIQNKLLSSRKELHNEWKRNTQYEVVFTNIEGTRYFRAMRKQLSYSDNKGNYMPFGGGSIWHVRYGCIVWNREVNFRVEEYKWIESSRKIFNKSSNGTIVPSRLKTKKEVLELAKRIGIFDMN